MFGTALICRDEGENDVGLSLRRELTFGLFRGFFEPLERHAIAGEIDLVLVLELLYQPVDDELGAVEEADK